MKNMTGASRLFGLLIMLPAAILMPAATAQESIRPAYTADYVAEMLDYVSRDYALAVRDGKVINEDEYVEQLNILAAALEVSAQVKALEGRAEVRSSMLDLVKLIKTKAHVDTVKLKAQSVRDQVLAAGGVRMAPERWPSQALGKEVFDKHCATCHGTAGDGKGPAAQALTPKPTNFLDPTRMAALSPFSAFSASRLGIRNTAMQGFSGLSEEELWAVSFYVLSLRYRVETRAATRLDPTALDMWRKAVATLPDVELLQALPGSGKARDELLAALRLHSGQP